MSYRKAIDRKCKECLFDPIGGSGKWREQTEACTAYSCPLFDVRPRSYAKLADSSPAKRTSILAREKG